MATKSPTDLNAENGRLRSENEELHLRLEVAERANVQLADVDRRKNDFLALLSHELRNPLTPIRNSIYVLERVAPGGEQARRALAVIGRQTKHLAHLIDDILDVTRISRDKLRLQRGRLDLVEVVRQTMEDHCAFLEHHQVVLDLPNEVISIDGDPTRLAQAIGNILINATKFTPENGRIAVSLTRTHDSAMLEVVDSGLGIDADTLRRIFEPFAQAERSLNRSRSGLGLGLALVKGIVDLHGGQVSAYSDGPGHGARFTISLPLDDNGAVAQVSPRPPRSVGRKVLVIDDNIDAAASLREALEFGDHQVEVAQSGPEGLEKALQFDPEFVLCALGLAGMDGYEVARAFRSDESLKGVHLVATTNGVQPEDIERVSEAGFEQHLSKSSGPEKIQDLLRRMPRAPLAGGRTRSRT